MAKGKLNSKKQNEKEDVIDKEVENDNTQCEEENNDEIESKTEEQARIEELESKLKEKQKESDEYLELLRRTMADFDNYRKRTNKEKESIYNEGTCDTVKEFLPVLDNLERAISYESVSDSLTKGVEMVYKQFNDILKKIGVEEIEAQGVEFDPDYHNAVMHIEDESLGSNVVVEVLQKGYKLKEKVLRHSVVKVAN